MKKLSDMFSYDLPHGAIEILGALHQEEHISGGVRTHRLPPQALERIPTRSMGVMVASAAGIRLRFATDAEQVAVEIESWVIDIVGGVRPYVAAVDLVVDGEVVAIEQLTAPPVSVDTSADRVDFATPARTVVRFDGLRRGAKLVEIWLPHCAVVDLHRVTANAPISPASPSDSPRWLHHGSSISHCLEASRPTRTWPAVAARDLGWQLTDLGFAGNAQLDPFVARAIRDTPAEIISLKVGVNLTTSATMTMRTFVPAVHGFLDTIRDGHTDTPILLISPIISPVLEQHAGPIRIDAASGKIECVSEAVAADALTLSRVRSALAAVAARRCSDDQRLYYIDGYELFDRSDADQGLLPDGLHPNADGYERIGQRFGNIVRGLPPRLRPPLVPADGAL